MDMSLYNNLVVLYIIFICVFVLRYSKNNTLYIFSPFLIFVEFILTDLIPIYMPHERTIPQIMYSHNIMAIGINVVFVLLYNKMYMVNASFNISDTLYRENERKRRILIVWCIGVLLISGLIGGTLIGFLRGQDMEDLRRTSEIGIGFIRDLPSAILQLLVIVYIIYNYKKSFLKAGLVCLFIGVFELVISGGNRGPLLSWVLIFLVYYGVTHRGLKWWEYAVYLMAFNIVAYFIGFLRRGLSTTDIYNNYTVYDAFSGNQNIFYENSISLVNLVQGGHFFYGQELYNAVVYIIPRFLWPDKPVSFGYTLKELAGYNFDGGGIGATLLENMYINWGDWWVLNYLLWILFIHVLYSFFLKSNSIYTKIIVVFLLIKGGTEVTFVRMGEILLIALIVMRIFYKKKCVI